MLTHREPFNVFQNAEVYPTLKTALVTGPKY
jgi:hypothetical protein